MRLLVRIQPRSSQQKLLPEGKGLKAWVNAPPVDGEANAALVLLISKSLGVTKSSVRIVRGETSRVKEVEVDGFETFDEVFQRLGDGQS
ncbi:MAG: DUF167 domain-containing protein [Fimbriimonadaceae bacterium]|nr:DUF167 domain-containing protein [Fimbriimonadaceae bacterium]MCE2768009.1 DUF167 domain-containing protein [Fimbriimonadaceae bacterium]